MKLKLVLGAFIICLFFAGAAFGQLRSRTTEKNAAPRANAEIRASAAYAEVLLQQTELESELEELLVAYTEEFPRVKVARYELKLLEAEMGRFGKMNSSDAPKLTLALGKLIVRRAEIATKLWDLTNRYDGSHPDVKRTKRKLSIFDAAIDEIL